MKVEKVVYDMAQPAKKLDVFLWLISCGRKGRLFIRKPTDFNIYTPTIQEHINCRCAPVYIDEDLK